jgi:hypothetical protein
MKDIPSSNFQKNADKSKTKSKFVEQFYENMISVPKKAKNVKDPNKIFQNVPVPDKYKEFVTSQPQQKNEPAVIHRVYEHPSNFEIEKSETLLPVASKFGPDSKRSQDLSAYLVDEDPRILASQAKDLLKYVKKFQDKQYNQAKSKIFDPTLAKRPNKKVIETSAISLAKLNKFNEMLAAEEDQCQPLDNDTQMVIEADSNEKVDKIESLKKKSHKLLRTTGSSKNKIDHISYQPLLCMKYYSREPDIEWWDQPYFQPLSQTANGFIDISSVNIPTMLSDSSYLQHISNLVPKVLPRLPKIKEENKITGLKLIPTKDEQRKFKRKERLEKQKQIQEKIKYGLLPAPPPRVKLSNFMKVLHSDAILNPTEIEQKVRQQIDERKQKHVIHNQANALTKEKKNDKLLRKARREAAKGIHLSIFLVKRLTNYEHQHILMKNTKQYYINGFALMPTGSAGNLPGVIITEGGPRYSNKIKKLILNRIKWTKEPAADHQSGSFAKLLWEGTLPEHKLKEWRTVKVQKEGDYIAFLKKQGFDNFVNLILNFNFQGS